MRNQRVNTAKLLRTKVVLVGLVALAVLASAALAARHRPADRARSANQILALRAVPARRVVAPGGATRFGIVLGRDRPPIGRGARVFAGAVRLSIIGLPPGSTASFSVNPIRGGMSLLRVRTSRRTPAGKYRLVALGRSQGRRATASLALVVARRIDHAAQVTGSISGRLVPGVSLPLNLTLRNTLGSLLQITRITVTLRGVSAPHAQAAQPCSVRDFATTQFSGAYGFALPAASANTLAGLGISSAQWPSIGMLDRSVNQDGCKGATLTLSYAAAGVWGGP